jgi:hypothetical protein
VVFIVRVWAEYVEQTPPTWRGEIEHVESKEVIRFSDLGEMDATVQHCVLAQLSFENEEDSR